MSKVAAYLRGHITGEVSTRDDVRLALSTDMGVLQVKPEIVIYPRTTNDIRKVARFAWQLAEKGHVLPITIRGAGTDSAGAAIGKGALLVTPTHMNKVFEYDPKQKLVRVQPGATITALQSALCLQGVTVPSLVGSHGFGTIGGAVSSGVSGLLGGKYGSIERAVDQLEVVLANGDVLQTGRINKRELNRKKGMQGLEGDIYRGIDAVIDEYSDVFEQISTRDNTGHNRIADVKNKDGSFDLTPLFVGSQGTLGFISEMIIRTEATGTAMAMASLVFASEDAARDALDELAKMNPALLEYFDATLFDAAAKAGRTYACYAGAAEQFIPQSVIMVGFDDANDRHRAKHIKKIAKKFDNAEGVYLVAEDSDETGELRAALDVAYYLAAPDHADAAAPAIFSGFYIPAARFEDFTKALKDVSAKEHIALPLAGHVLTGIYSVYPTVSVHKVADKQKIIKLLDVITLLVDAHGGSMISEGGEGRLKARAVYSGFDQRVIEMYEAVRKVCDPLGTLNPGVKQQVDVRTMAGMLRDSHEIGQFARFGL